MSEGLKIGVLLFCGLVLAGFFSGGWFVVAGDNNGAFVVNKFTGSVTRCSFLQCNPIKFVTN